MGVPSKCWYMKTLEPEDRWRPTYGTILTIETSRWVPQGTQVQLFVVDRDGNPFVKGCQRHRERNGKEEAFIFRDPYNPSKIYPMSVSTNQGTSFQYKITILAGNWNGNNPFDWKSAGGINLSHMQYQMPRTNGRPQVQGRVYEPRFQYFPAVVSCVVLLSALWRKNGVLLPMASELIKGKL